MNYDDSDNILLDFYNLKSLEPQSLDDVYEAHSRRFLEQDVNLEDVDQLDLDSCIQLVDGLLKSEEEGVELEVSVEDDNDPLMGSNGSVLRYLVANRIITSETDRTKKKYLVSSKNFDSIEFLTKVHNKDSINQLLTSLNHLETSIYKQSKDLKKLINSKYLKFVNSKNSIDDILRELNKDFNEKNQFKLSPLESSLSTLNLNATLAVKPLADLKSKEKKMLDLMRFIDENKYFFNLPSKFNTYLAEKDYDNLVHDYKQFKEIRKKYIEDADGGKIPSLIDRIWQEIEIIIDSYKERLYKQLVTVDFGEGHGSTNNLLHLVQTHGADADSSKRFINLVSKLNDIGIEDNPSLQFISLQISNLSEDFNVNWAKFTRRWSVQQTKLARILGNIDINCVNRMVGMNDGEDGIYDVSMVVESWLILVTFSEYLQGQLSWKFDKIWQNVRYLRESSQGTMVHLDDYELGQIKQEAETLIAKICMELVRFFSGENKAVFDFFPANTNSVSAVFYLDAISTNIATALSVMGSFNISSKVTDVLRTTNSSLNQRIVEGVCSIWIRDIAEMYSLERWEPNENAPDVEGGVNGYTKLPSLIEKYQLFMISKLSSIIFWKGVDNYEIKIISYPSKKLLTGIKIQFLRSLDVLTDSLMKIIVNGNEVTMSKSDELYNLLTHNNLELLRSSTIPGIIGKYDSNFKDTLKNENLKIFSIIEKFELTVFENYSIIQRNVIKTVIKRAFESGSSLDKMKKEPTGVSNYIYETLIHFAVLNTKISPISYSSYSKLVSQLQQNVLTLIMEKVRNDLKLTQFNSHQLMLDLVFYEKIFQYGNLKLDETCLKLIGVINRDLAEVGRGEFNYREALKEALRESQVEFGCFKN